MPTGGHVLVKALSAHDVSRVYCVAGESYLPVLDGFLDFSGIDVVTCRHESGATFMAESYGNLHGKPGVALVTRGPGACNASIGVHTAMQSSTPMILFVGLINTVDRDKEAFQEFDIKSMFGSLSKWASVIDTPERIGEYVARAYHVAVSGRPGPVVLGLPEDILFPEVADQAIKTIPQTQIAPTNADIKAVQDMLSAASSPLVIVGGGGWSAEACENLASFASKAHLPVVTAFRRQDIFNHHDGNYIGELGTGPNPVLVERVRQADVILALNTRLNEITTQEYSLFQEGQKIIQTYPSAEEFGKSVIPDLTVTAHIEPLSEALAAAMRLDGRKWAGWRDEGRQEYLRWSAIDQNVDRKWKGADMTQIYAFLQDALPKDAIVTTDAGNFSGWAQRYLRYGRPGRLLAPVSGAMGYAAPSAVAASIEQPERVVLGLCGDGGFMMSGQELATALHHGAKPIMMVCNNGMYGTIRMHQDKHYPGRVSGTGLTNPDFVKLAESYGAFTARVEDAADFPKVWQQAVGSGTLALIEVVQDPAQITTRS